MTKGYLYIILTAVLFSTMEISLKLASSEFNPVQLIFIRFLIGAIILLPLALKDVKSKRLSLNKEDLKFFMLTGFICVVVSMIFYQLAIVYCKASIVAVLFSCNPVFVIPFAYFLLKEKIYKHTIISMVISIIGMIFTMNPFKMHLGGNAVGVLFAIISAITFALYGVVGKLKTEKYGAVVLSCFSFFMGCIEIFILILLSRIGFVSNLLLHHGLKVFADIPIFHGITLHTIPGLIYIGIFVTGFGYLLYFLAMKETSAATASMVFYIKPALAPILATIILGETIAPTTITGIILIIIGSGITFISNRKATRVTRDSSL